MLKRIVVLSLAAFALLLSPGPARARPDSGGAGAALSLGDGGYGGLSLYGDLGWKRGALSPYAWTELLTDNYIGQLTAGAGSWLEARGGGRVKAGLGVSTGRLREWEGRSSALSVELGAERDLRGGALAGGELRVTRGRIPGTRAGAAVREEIVEAGRRARRTRIAKPELETFTTRELAAYFQAPWRDAFLRPRLALIRSEGDSVLSAGITYLLPRGPRTFSAGLTLESGDSDAAYLTLGFYHRFF